MSLTQPATNEGTKRTRYTGPVELVELGEEAVDLSSSGLGRGRPSVDLSPYKKILTENYGKNFDKNGKNKSADGTRVMWFCQVTLEAVGTVKSRFNTAAAEVNLGVTYSVEDLGNGQAKVGVTAQKRAVGRGRKKVEEANGK